MINEKGRRIKKLARQIIFFGRGEATKIYAQYLEIELKTVISSQGADV